MPLRSPWTHLFGASVLADGTVYAGASMAGCGRGAQIVRLEEGRWTTLQRLARDRDVDRAQVTMSSKGSPLVYFTEYRCSNGRLDIHRFTDPKA